MSTRHAGRNDAKLIADVQEFSELEEAFDRPIRTYSAGMKARLFFALATARKSKIYVIDEVLSVGDEYFQNKCWRRIRQRLAAALQASSLRTTGAPCSASAQTATSSRKAGSWRVGRAPGRQAIPRAVNRGFGERGAFRSRAAAVRYGRSLEISSSRSACQRTESCRLHFGVAIEMFEPGSGWEHVLHADNRAGRCRPWRIQGRAVNSPVAAEGGRVFALPLPFEVRPKAGLVPLDVRSWTYGEDLTLRVEGDDVRRRDPLAATAREPASEACSGVAKRIRWRPCFERPAHRCLWRYQGLSRRRRASLIFRPWPM